ncbi:MAG: prepilin-type N-terminal cleavage/methylation domain-containing protein [Candidatus Krumholzibacteriota bacterium]|nr:prepilin-type N-terminal cleavage/methylation domain-containing protein [Candidatus Krumholzibacteriota bacterium]
MRECLALPCSHVSGMTLIELIITITIIGIIVMAGAPLLIDLMTTMSVSQGKAGINRISRESYAGISGEIRSALGDPLSMRPWVSPDGLVLRIYRNSNQADSIRYYFESNGESVFLFRSAAGGAGVLVPSFADRDVDYMGGSFFVDNGNTGYSTTGQVGLNVKIRKDRSIEPDSTIFEFGFQCRNY